MYSVYLVYEDNEHRHAVKDVIGIFFEQIDAYEWAAKLEKERDDNERERAKTSTIGFIEPEDRDWRCFTVEHWNVR